MKNVLKVVFVIIGTIIGAGFASGKEIYLFFYKYGVLGILGIIISGGLTGFIIYKTLKISYEKDIKLYDVFINKINKKYCTFNKVIKAIIDMFLLISFYIMVAGFSTYVNQVYNIPIVISSVIFIFICYLVFKRNVTGVIKSNEVLVPLLILLMVYLGIKNIPFLVQSKFEIYEQSNLQNYDFLIKSILYASYNSIILIPVLINLKDYLNSKKSIIKISIISSGIIVILSMLIYGLLLRGNFYVSQMELPLANICLEFGNIFKYLYAIIIILSIFTSAISAGYGFLKSVSKDDKKYNKNLALMCITSIFVSYIGFGKLIQILYPLFGILGLSQIFLIFKYKSIEKKGKN